MDGINVKTILELGVVGVLALIIIIRDVKNYKETVRRENKFVEVIEKNTIAINEMTSQFKEKRREIAEQDMRFEEFFKKFDHFISILNDKLIDIIKSIAS